MSFLWTRVAMLLEFVMLPVPVITLIAKVVEWSDNGSKWTLVLVFFFTTAIVQLSIMMIYPRLIAPLYASHGPLPEHAKPLEPFIKEAARTVGFPDTKIKHEISFDYDPHTNASCCMGFIVLSSPIFKHHG